MKKHFIVFLSLAFSLSYNIPILANQININLPIQNVAIDKTNSFIYDDITYTITQKSSETLKGYVYISNGKDFKGKNLNIPKSVQYQGKNYTVEGISPYAFYQNDNIENVTIPNTIKDIGIHSFTDCQNLQNINVIAGANKYASIDGVLFNVARDTLITYPTGKLDKQYKLPNNVTKIEQGAFYNNRNLEHFIANSDLQEISSYAFANSKKLKEVSGIVKLKTLGDYAFANSSIQTIYLSTYVENMGKGTFLNSNIKNIEIPYQVKILPEYSFYNCKDLKTVTFKDGLTNISAFAFANSDIENFVAPETLSLIDFQAFANCNNLKSIKFNDKLTTIKDEAFLNCSSLQKLIVNRDLTEIGKNAFYKCDNIDTVSSDKSIHFDISDNLLYTTNRKELVYVPPKREVTYVNIPKETTSIREDALVNINSIDTFNVEEKNEYFSSQDGILYDKEQKSLIKFPPKKLLTNFNIPSTIEKIYSYAFKDATNLYGYIFIPENVTNIEKNAFYNNPNIDGFSINSANDKYTVYEDILYNKDKSSIIKYPARKKLDNFTIPKETKNISEAAFQQANINTLNIGLNVTNIEKQAFLDAPIKQININEGIKDIKDEAFKGTNIENLIIPSTLESIGDKALAYCKNLKTIQFNVAKINSFGYNMFEGSSNLKKIIVPLNSYNNYKNYLINSNNENCLPILEENKNK